MYNFGNVTFINFQGKQSGSFQSSNREFQRLLTCLQTGEKNSFICFVIFNKCDDSVFGKCKSFTLSHFGDATCGQGRCGDLHSIPLC